MEGRRLILADGTTFENGEVGYADGNLWCWIPNCSMQTAVNVFMNPVKTKRIVFQYGDMEDAYNGFTNCTNIMADPDRKASVCLQKP